jgi:transcription elongation GreA/GreB family factor
MNIRDIPSRIDSRAMARHVTLDSVVDYEEMPAGTRRTIMLVAPQHADEREGRISTFAPMGRALLGLPVASTTEIVQPNGNCSRVQIVAVRPGGSQE